MHLKILKNKDGAVELSIGTIVIIVIAMSMLILGLILVKNIFTGSIYNVKSINDKVKEEINNLFDKGEDKSIVYLSERKAEVEQGAEWGVAFAFRNLETGTTQDSTFSYEVVASDLGTDCKGLTKAQAESWIKSRRSNSLSLPPGDKYHTIARFQIPEDAPLCIIPFNIEVKKDGAIYTTDFFDLIIKAKGLL